MINEGNKERPDYSKEESLTQINFDNIGGGDLKKIVDSEIAMATTEALVRRKFNNVEKGSIKINIEITVEAIDDMSFEIKGKVKKVLPKLSCISIAVGDEQGLYVRKDGRGGDPLQENIDYEEDNEVLTQKKKAVNDE